jgi:hypothetical protein
MGKEGRRRKKRGKDERELAVEGEATKKPRRGIGGRGNKG